MKHATIMKLIGFAHFIIAAWYIRDGIEAFTCAAGLEHQVSPTDDQRIFIGHAAAAPEIATQKPATGDARTYLHGLAAEQDAADDTA